jgi:hypothetical protein
VEFPEQQSVVNHAADGAKSSQSLLLHLQQKVVVAAHLECSRCRAGQAGRVPY